MLRLGIHRVGGPEGTSDVRGRDPGGLELTSMSEDGWKLVCISGASHLVATASCHGGSPWWSSSWALHGGGAHARRACAHRGRSVVLHTDSFKGDFCRLILNICTTKQAAGTLFLFRSRFEEWTTYVISLFLRSGTLAQPRWVF